MILRNLLNFPKLSAFISLPCVKGAFDRCCLLLWIETGIFSCSQASTLSYIARYCSADAFQEKSVFMIFATSFLHCSVSR